MVERGTPRRLPRLQPEREGPHHRRRIFGAPDTRRARLGAARLERGRRLRTGRLHPRDDAEAVHRNWPPARGDGSQYLHARFAARAFSTAGKRRPRRCAVATALSEAGGGIAARRAVARGSRGARGAETVLSLGSWVLGLEVPQDPSPKTQDLNTSASSYGAVTSS